MKINFVGAGPGAKDLITLRGKELIEKADIIVYAGSLVNPALLEYAAPACEIYNSATMTLDEVMDVMIKGNREGKSVVRLHTGDPSIYGAIGEQMAALDKAGIEYEICPGVSACFGAAADMKLEYTLPGISQTLIITRAEGRTPLTSRDGIASLASHGLSMAIYLSTGLLDKVQKELICGGYDPKAPAAICYKATWPDEKILYCHVDELEQTAKKEGIKNTALILVGDILKKADFNLSKLYSPDFETLFRGAVKK